MPRAIANIGVGNPATYTLTGTEEFTVLAVSCVFAALSHNPPYGYPTIEWRDAGDGLIYRQTLNTILNDFIGVSGAAEGEPWYVSNAGPFGFPQDTEQQSNATMSIRLPRITLTSGCTLGVYVATYALNGNENPTRALSTDFTITDAHLWVQDAPGRKVLPPNPPPLLVHEPA